MRRGRLGEWILDANALDFLPMLKVLAVEFFALAF
jgi:hypothetical protein